MSKTEKVQKLESKLTKLENKVYETRVKIEAEKHHLHKSTVKALGLI
jgi:outer membrane murein-binding lipoprotein Lpp